MSEMKKQISEEKIFWENKGWIHEIGPYGCFQWYFRYWLGRRSINDKRPINRWKKIMSRFRGK